MGASSIVDVSCYFTIGPGQQRHSLSFSRPDLYEPHFRPKFEYRLGAAEFISIVNGLGDDMREYATQVQADEQEIAPLFAQIDAFVENMKT